MSNKPEETITLTARCHCKQNSITVEIPKSKFPLQSTICSCNSCRHASGTLVPTTCVVPTEPPDVSKLSAYKSSNHLTRYFCPNCGADLCSIEDDGWDFMTGTLDKAEGLLDRYHIWIDDTGDGGVGVFLEEIGGKKINRFKVTKTSGEVEDETIKKLKKESEGFSNAPNDLSVRNQDDKLHFKCHCGGVSFYFTRPMEDNPGPDPKHMDKNNGKWWLEGNRYVTSPCPCTSCRIATGYEILTWIYVPTANVFWEDGTPIKYDMGTLKTYSSSPQILREFCGTCGATVTYRSEKRAVDVVDIASGLVVGNSRAESWLYWRADQEGEEEDALDNEFAKSLNHGISKWYGHE